MAGNKQDPSSENLEKETADNEDSPCIGEESAPEVTVVQDDYIPDRWNS